MPSQTTERAFEIYVEEILLTGGGWKSGSNGAVARWQACRTALITAAVSAKIDAPSHSRRNLDGFAWLK